MMFFIIEDKLSYCRRSCSVQLRQPEMLNELDQLPNPINLKNPTGSNHNMSIIENRLQSQPITWIYSHFYVITSLL